MFLSTFTKASFFFKSETDICKKMFELISEKQDDLSLLDKIQIFKFF